MSSVVLEHPALGKVTGRQHDGVEQYLGIQYAKLKDRLAEPVLRTDYGGIIDASEHGPSSYGAPGGFEAEVGAFIQNAIPKPDLRHSDVDCLNLSITVPADARKGKTAKLPVFIWIHGGGNAVGSHSWPHYDHARLVRLSAENGLPMIGVGINYRLGLSAAITSQELRKAGYKGNNYLRDQRTAFAWVKKHIGGFGGDASNVTVLGESAGAMSVTLHLCSKQPLFERAFVTGGTCLFSPARPSAFHETTYEQATAALGLANLSPEDRIKALLTMPVDEINAKLPPSVQPNALIDNDILHSGLTYADLASPDTVDNALPSKQWLQALAIGDCQFDASVLYFLLAHLKPLSRKFPGSVRATLAAHPDQAEKLLSLYNLSSSPSGDADDDDDDETTFLKALSLINDTSFSLGTLAFANAFSSTSPTSSSTSTTATKTNVFFFNEPNPWPGKFQGRATHILDVVFLFQNYNDALPPAQRDAARRMGLDFARFVRGGGDGGEPPPWPTYRAGDDDDDSSAGRKVKVYGPSGTTGAEPGGDDGAVSRIVDDAVLASAAETGRKPEIVAIADAVGWDLLGSVVVDFLVGKHLT